MKYNDKDEISKIFKIPYYGKSSQMIININFIGYEMTNLNKLIFKKQQFDINDISQDSFSSAPHNHNNDHNNNKEFFQRNHSLNNSNDLMKFEENDEIIILDEKPIVLYDQSSNYSNGNISNETIISAIYPENPNIYIQKNNHNNKGKFDERDSCVIFSYHNPYKYDNDHESTKTTFHYFAYKFYEAEEIGSNKYYCPFAICILSYFPYYSSFKAIAFHLKKMITSFSLIPKEFFLFNIVNYLPSPVVCSIKLDLKKNEDPKTQQFQSQPQLQQQQQIDSIYFKQLTGYPMLQYDISEIIKILSPEIFIQIFILTFMEIDAMLFSNDIELLNITMYTIANLNYPMNESDYYSTIVSLSKEMILLKQDYDSNNNDKKIRKMIGINASYNDDIASLLFKKKNKNDYCIIDLDKKNVQLFNVDDKIKEVLLSYVHNIITKEKKSPHNNIPFAKAIYELYQEVKIFKMKGTQSQQGLMIPKFFIKPYEKELVTLDKTNRNIQEAFYSFMIKIMALIYKNYHLISPDKTQVLLFTINYIESITNNHDDNEIKPTINEEYEKELMILFKQTIKYSRFISQYLQNSNITNASYIPQLPLIFFEEFIYQFSNNNSLPKSKPITQFFNAIDIFYDIESSYAIGLDFKAFEEKLSIPIIKQIKYNHNFNDSLIDNDNSNDNYFFFQNRFELLKFQSKKHRIKLASIYSLNASNHINYYNYIENLSNEELSVIFPLMNQTIKQYEIQQVNFNDQVNYSAKKKLNSKRRLDKFQLDKGKLRLCDISYGNYIRIQEAIEANSINQKIIDKNEFIILAFIIFYAVTRKNMKCCITKYDHFNLIYYIILRKKKSVICRRLITLLIICYSKQIKLNIQSNIDYSYEKNCLTSLILLLIKLDMIPNRELKSYLDWAYQMNLIIIDNDNYTKDINELSKFSLCQFVIDNNEKGLFKPEKSKKKAKNYLKYNLAADKERKYANYFIGLAENNNQYNGNYNVHFVTQETKAKMPTEYQNKIDNEKTTWVIQLPSKQLSTLIYSPMKLYTKCVNLINSILIEPSIIINDKDIMKNLSCNFIFYIENISNILQVEEDTLLIKEYMLDLLYTILIHTQK